MSNAKYVVADIGQDTRKRVQEIAKAEKMTRAVMMGRLVEAGILVYEKKAKK